MTHFHPHSVWSCASAFGRLNSTTFTHKLSNLLFATVNAMIHRTPPPFLVLFRSKTERQTTRNVFCLVFSISCKNCFSTLLFYKLVAFERIAHKDCNN